MAGHRELCHLMRAFFTDETVDIIQPSNSFDSPSVGWEWEQAWMIDTNEQSYDKEVGFLSHFYFLLIN